MSAIRQHIYQQTHGDPPDRKYLPGSADKWDGYQLGVEEAVGAAETFAPVAPPTHYQDVLVALFQDPHHRPTADSTLNELHQHGWKVVPR